MQYETASQMAARLGVTIRTVQLWAKNDRLPGAIKQGRDWLIPTGLGKPGKTDNTPKTERIPLALINGSFMPGSCTKFIDDIEDPILKRLAMTEHYYFTGKPKLAADTAETFFHHDDVVVSLSACLIYSFANLTLGNISLAELGLNCIRESLYEELHENATLKLKAACILIATAAFVLLHQPPPEENLIDYIKYLPPGLQLCGYYLLSHTAFLQEEYQKALGIIETALSINTTLFPLATIYLHLAAAMNLMGLRRINAAKKQVLEAWEMAMPDNFIAPFIEHDALLCGLIKACIKPQYPLKYKAIEDFTLTFTNGWHQTHNNISNQEAAFSLTTTEIAIAMLANKGWSNTEIADYLHLSLHTVKRYISVIYQKLGVTHRSELKQYIHQ